MHGMISRPRTADSLKFLADEPINCQHAAIYPDLLLQLS
jgi:hypothetical protein